jgi:tRNA A-37 threonylcarbamoyl transferase component Bud32
MAVTMVLQTPADASTEPYALLQTLVPERTFLCSDVSSNILVLKRLDDDCLHQHRLHPAIRDRLAHVRDLPHARLATLRGVERWNGQTCLVWSWLDGETWDEAIETSTEDFGSLASSLAEAVDALHEMGIVHGSIHSGNIIVRRDRQVWLTDVSPYLYTDPAADINALAELLDAAGKKLPGEIGLRLSRLVGELRDGSLDLRQLSRGLRNLHAEEAPISVIENAAAGGYRRSSLIAAALLALVGAAVWVGIRHVASATLAAPTTFPSLRSQP